MPWKNHVKHLGNTLSYNLCDEYDVQVKRGHFWLETKLCVVFFSCRHFLLSYVVDDIPIRDQLLKRCVKLYESCDTSKNSIIQLLVSNAIFENTPVGTNMNYIAMYSTTNVKVGSEEDGRGQLLYSLLYIREQYWEIAEFTREEVE